MDEETESRPGVIARLTAEPLQLRRWSRFALLLMAIVVIAGQLISGPSGATLTALTWVVAPFIGLGIGVGDGFFVRFGRGLRRITVTILASVFVALMSCAILANASKSSTTFVRDLAVASLYALLYVGIVLGLAGLIAIGIGRGEVYVSDRIDRMSREDW
jgi:hypothetical protein